MTVASETNRSGPYTGNGVTTSFDYDFRILDAEHIRVIRAQGSIETQLTLNVDYTVSGVGDDGGGSIATTVAPSALQTITMLRDVPFTQEIDLENQGPYFAETMEGALDLATMRDQQLSERLGRTISFPDSDPISGGMLAPVATRKNKVLGFGTNGELIYVSGPGGGSSGSVSAIGVFDVDSRSTAQITSIPEDINIVRTGGYTIPGDGGASHYMRLGSAPAPMKRWHFQSADGAWWELTELSPEVRMFGAVGDGATNDKAAIRAAIEYARGATLRFSKGVFFVEELSASEIFLIDQAIRLVGAGASIEGTWIRVSASTIGTCDLFHIKPAQASIPFVEFSGLHISPQTPETFVGYRHAIHIETDAATQLQRFHIADCWINAGVGYAIYGEDTDVSVSTAAYYQSVIERNVLFGFGGGIRFTQAGDSITIADNVFVGGGRAIYIKAVSGAAMQIIEKNGFQGTPLGAIQLVDCVQTKVRNNQIEQGVAYGGIESGLIVLDNCIDCDLIGNNINGFDQVTPIRLRSGSARNRIKDNTIAVANGAMRHVVVDVASGTLNVIGASNTFIVGVAKAEPLVEVGIAPQSGVISQLSMFNSWIEDTTGYLGLFYRVNEDDTVSLFGNIKNGLATAGVNIAQLPIGIRPSKVCYLPVWCSGNTIGLLAVGTDGFISVSTALPNNTAVKIIDARYPLA
ncbi:hypothetical protein A1D31_14245 [Bradyrhizobium liaoningense]|nr:hypothetical protein A1D31_14245 [Bradyrhizobium liaoningense]